MCVEIRGQAYGMGSDFRLLSPRDHTRVSRLVRQRLYLLNPHWPAGRALRKIHPGRTITSDASASHMVTFSVCMANFS